MNMFNLKGKKAIVTGASGGIGYALVKGMVEAGIEVARFIFRRKACNLIFCSRNSPYSRV